jgi:hypothetical protein
MGPTYAVSLLAAYHLETAALQLAAGSGHVQLDLAS